jgi:hypothetical protein
VQHHVRSLQQLGWQGLLAQHRHRSDLQIRDSIVGGHPAAGVLNLLSQQGAPATMAGAPWSRATISERIARGSHQSCQSHMPFLREELLAFDSKGFWLVLPYKEVLRLLDSGEIKSFRVSPLGIVPQRDRRPRLIVDLSFYGVNSDTIQRSPAGSMQFGRALERILYLIRHSNPQFGPVHLGKIDLSDGFYRVALDADAVSELATVLPRYANEEQLIAFPLVLPMGWVESPPWFCAATETIADLANHWPAHLTPPPHPLEAAAQTPPQVLQPS